MTSAAQEPEFFYEYQAQDFTQSPDRTTKPLGSLDPELLARLFPDLGIVIVEDLPTYPGTWIILRNAMTMSPIYEGLYLVNNVVYEDLTVGEGIYLPTIT